MDDLPAWLPAEVKRLYSTLGLFGSIASIIAVLVSFDVFVWRLSFPSSWSNAAPALIADLQARIVRYLPNLVMAAGACAFGVDLYVGYGKRADFVVAVAALLGIAIIWSQEYRYGRKAAYAEAVRDLHAAVHNLRDAHENLQRSSEGEFSNQIQNAAELVARAFSVVTRTSCRACVKTIVPPPDVSRDELRQMDDKELTHRLLVKIVARSASSVQRDSIRADYLDENSDFLAMFRNPDMRCFLSNNLTKSFRKQNYRNPGIPEGFDVDKDPWPLVYRSTLVWPIRKRDSRSEVNAQQHLLGFLCVDSRARGVFWRRYDFDTGAIVADALYVYMKRYFELHRESGGG